MLNGKNSTFFSKNSGKNLRISKNVCTFALEKQKQLTIKTITIMKTYFIIERKQARNFVLKGEQLYCKTYAMTRNSFAISQRSAKRFASQEDAENYAKKWFKDFIGEVSVISYVIY